MRTFLFRPSDPDVFRLEVARQMTRLFRTVIAAVGIAGFLAVVASCAATIGTTDPEDAVAPSDKLDASLRSAMANRSDGDTLAILIELDSDVNGEVAEGLAALGFEVESSSGRIRTGRATVAAIRQIAAERGVRSISLSQERQMN
jgi:hypothetical protein